MCHAAETLLNYPLFVLSGDFQANTHSRMKMLFKVMV